MHTHPSQQILDYLDDRREQMTLYLRWLVLAESPSLVPPAQRPVFALLGDKLRAMDYRVREVPGRTSGGLLFARPYRRRRSEPAQLLLGHSDTVWPEGTLAHMPVSVAGDTLRGPGVYDMKGGLAQIIFALQAIHDLGLEPSVAPLVLVNSDEEIGSVDSHTSVARLARAVDRALVLEPSLGPAGKLKTARKGVMRFSVTIHGKAAHAGLAPEEGVSAILELSYVIQKLFAINDPDQGVTVNVGAVDGGLRPNVIAPQSNAQVDVRVPTVELGHQVADRIRALEAQTPGTSVVIEQLRWAPPMEPTERNRRLWHLARDLGKEVGLVLEEATSGGASDGNTTSQFTATLDGLGPVGGGAHAAHEHVSLDSMIQRTALLALLVLAPPLGGH